MNKTTTRIIQLFCTTGLMLFAGVVFNMVGWHLCSAVSLVLAIATGSLCVGVVAWDTVKGEWR